MIINITSNPKLLLTLKYMCIRALARTCAYTHVGALLLSWLDGCPPGGDKHVSEPGNGFYVVLPVRYDKIFTTKHIYYIVEKDFLQIDRSVPNVPDVSDVSDDPCTSTSLVVYGGRYQA